MAGEVASLIISRMAVPVLYFMAFNRRHPPPVQLIAAAIEPGEKPAGQGD